MRLMTAHKILITAAIAMFGLLTLWSVRRGVLTGEMTSYLAAAALSGATTAALVAYYRNRFRAPRA
jgi:hypothetical protein